MTNIHFDRIDKKTWLSYIPNLIAHLKLNYNFFYNKRLVRFKGLINELIDRKVDTNKHKMITYINEEETQVYFVVYKKGFVNVYYCDDYANASDSNRNYFVNKFWKHYLEAKHMRELIERKNYV